MYLYGYYSFFRESGSKLLYISMSLLHDFSCGPWIILFPAMAEAATNELILAVYFGK
jgi:hypothetical protein